MFKKIITTAALVASMTAYAFQPSGPITATIGYGPGSGNELSFRAVSALIEKQNPTLNFIVNNIAGAGEVAALSHFGQQVPNGRSMYIISQNNFAIQEEWYPGALKFKMDDLVLVTNIAKSPLCIVAHVSSSVNTPKDLIDKIKNTKTPVSIAYGAGGQRLMFEYMMENVGGNTELVKSIPYKGPAQALQDVAAGHVEMAILPTAVANTMMSSGKIKFIALAGDKKLVGMPTVPLMKDYIPGMTYFAAWGIALPVGTPKEHVEYYRNLFVPVINSGDAKEFFDKNMMQTYPEEHTPEGLRKYINSVNKQWLPYARKHNPNK
jgi:tripartite-type tricarboxylate transporter receptor subunit TctC